MSLIGQELRKLDTPVLWVDLDLMEQNIQQVAGYLRQAGVAWRPHTKGIKIPAIAHKLLRAGAIGVTCAKLSEAEVMAAAGIGDILIGSQLVGEQKMIRLAALRRQADVIVSISELENGLAISRAAQSAGVRLRAVIELNIGMERAGVAPGSPAVELACCLNEMPGLEFVGLMGWEGHVVSIPDPNQKLQAGEKAIQLLVETADACRQAGLPVHIVSCGGSGSYKISSHIPGVTEIQAGGAIFGDVTYRKWGAGTKPSLYVQCVVTSRPAPNRAMIDAGQKAVNAAMSFPEVVGLPGVKLVRLSAEHGNLELEDPNIPLKAGDLITLMVGYGDWTLFMHDYLVGVRNGVVEVVWPILGRGKIT